VPDVRRPALAVDVPVFSDAGIFPAAFFWCGLFGSDLLCGNLLCCDLLCHAPAGIDHHPRRCMIARLFFAAHPSVHACIVQLHTRPQQQMVDTQP